MSGTPLGEREDWKLETRQAGSDGLEIVLGGRWCLDQSLPPHEVLQAGLHEGIRRLHFSVADLGAWDSGLLVFLAGLVKS